MSFTFNRRSYSSLSVLDTGTTKATEESKKKSSLLKDNSWIKKDANSGDVVDRDVNYGRSVLTRFRSSGNLISPTETGSTFTTPTTSTTLNNKSNTSVKALTGRFSASQDELHKSSTLPANFRRSTSSIKSATSFEEPKLVTTGRHVKSAETTVATSSVTTVKTPTKTEVYSEQILTDVKTPKESVVLKSPTKTNIISEKVAKTSKESTVVKSPTKVEIISEKVVSDVRSSPRESIVVKSPSKTEIIISEKVVKTSNGKTSKESAVVKSPTKVEIISEKVVSDVKTSPRESNVVKSLTKTEIISEKVVKTSDVKVVPKETFLVKSPTKTEIISEKVVSEVKTSPKETIVMKSPTKVEIISEKVVSEVKTSPKETILMKSPTKVEIISEKVVSEVKTSPKETIVKKSPTKVEIISEKVVSEVKTSPKETVVIKSPTKMEIISEKVVSNVKMSPHETTNKLTSKSLRAVDAVDGPPTEGVPKTEVVTLRTSKEISNIGESKDVSSPTRTTTSRSSDAPVSRAVSSSISTTSSTTAITPITATPDSKQSRGEKTSVSSCGVYTGSPGAGSRSEDYLSSAVTTKSTNGYYSSPDASYTATSYKTVYTTPERIIHETDLCNYCRRPLDTDVRMVMEDMNINCHASCLKCEVCSASLGHLRAGESMWVYRRTLHCERCFGVSREKWRH
ncbi:sciellin isoform X5 [Denticeps clupeoides]|uniref:sciellin isoform X4 n=1 Tax=Denticeps clupeoides TaxID=299321 RepID=UPI0010A38B14|nr:sciellin-like isoform X4 [Denticeps clupeoides]XP_028848105.1 sciellin-like isoform X5 [Denticeps clupeoides]